MSTTHPHRTRRVAAVVAAVAAALLAAACVAPAPAPSPAPRPRHVVVYGDSYVDESAAAIRAAFAAEMPGRTVTIRSHGGTAPCDWTSRLRADLDALKPEAVVFAFTGNMLTPYTGAALFQVVSDAETVARYRTDLGGLLRAATTAGADTAVIVPPGNIGVARHPLGGLYQQLADQYKAALVNTANLFAPAPGAAASLMVPCAPADRCAATVTEVQVRTGYTHNPLFGRILDHHLCVAGTRCDTAAGPLRYADAIVNAALAATGHDTDGWDDRWVPAT